MSGQVVVTMAELDALPEDTLIEATGTYLRGGGGFSRCWARPIPEGITGPRAPGESRLWEVLVYAGDAVSHLTTSALITHATVLYRPDATPEGEDVIERAARVLSKHWLDMHTNEALGYQRMLAGALADAGLLASPPRTITAEQREAAVEALSYFEGGKVARIGISNRIAVVLAAAGIEVSR